MASLNGVKGNTLVPAEPPKKVEMASEERRTRTKVEVVEENCTGCGALLSGKALRRAHDWQDFWSGWVQDEEEALCEFCAQVLPAAQGRGMGSTRNARDTLEKLAKISDSGMVVMLSTVNVGTEDGGHVRLDFGDVFKVSRVGAPLTDKAGRDRSFARFTAEVNVGPVKVTLWPREIAAMNLLTVLNLQRDGDYEMAYVSTDDREGYFTLTPKAKELAIATFGDR